MGLPFFPLPSFKCGGFPCSNDGPQPVGSTPPSVGWGYYALRPPSGGSSTNFCTDQTQSPPPSPPGTCPEEADAPGGYYPTPADTSATPPTCAIEV